MIKLVRIDDRLVHGQVSFTWVTSLGIDCLIVANDKVAVDEFQKMTLKLAKPPSARLFVFNLKDAMAFLNDQRNINLKILLIINNVKDACDMAKSVPEIRSVNFGGIRTKDGSKLISKAVALNDDDIILVREMLSDGLELEIRQVPSDRKILIESLLP